jgi:hypothetical protein
LTAIERFNTVITDINTKRLAKYQAKLAMGGKEAEKAKLVVLPRVREAHRLQLHDQPCGDKSHDAKARQLDSAGNSLADKHHRHCRPHQSAGRGS